MGRGDCATSAAEGSACVRRLRLMTCDPHESHVCDVGGACVTMKGRAALMATTMIILFWFRGKGGEMKGGKDAAQSRTTSDNITHVARHLPTIL